MGIIHPAQESVSESRLRGVLRAGELRQRREHARDRRRSLENVRGHRGVTRWEAVHLEANRAARRRGCGRRVERFSRFGYVKVQEDSSRVPLSA